MQWRKSSLSGPWTDNCVEIAYSKSSLSGNNGSCVETHIHGDQIHVRDSKDPDGPYLTFNRDEWLAFLGGVELGEFPAPAA